MGEPKFKLDDYARVKATAPESSAPGERVQVIAIDEVKAGDPLVDRFGLPAGIMYICLFWIDGSDYTCFVAERDMEPDY